VQQRRRQMLGGGIFERALRVTARLGDMHTLSPPDIEIELLEMFRERSQTRETTASTRLHERFNGVRTIVPPFQEGGMAGIGVRDSGLYE